MCLFDEHHKFVVRQLLFWSLFFSARELQHSIIGKVDQIARYVIQMQNRSKIEQRKARLVSEKSVCFKIPDCYERTMWCFVSYCQMKFQRYYRLTCAMQKNNNIDFRLRLLRFLFVAVVVIADCQCSEQFHARLENDQSPWIIHSTYNVHIPNCSIFFSWNENNKGKNRAFLVRFYYFVYWLDVHANIIGISVRKCVRVWLLWWTQCNH